ncbi:hypothetical protein [Yeosuana sp.]|uniref:hypothetical protein n=1 Tax=Yeosuana sp. TaxID=2529388 RepID=UPI0040552E5C|tara:strand:+ start:111 stop:770 length:660 start_codon:yes stop_codon:yes gene_type:complete
MKTFLKRAKTLFGMIAQGKLIESYHLLRTKIYSNKKFLVLRRDLKEEFIDPVAKIDLKIRLQEEKDLSHFIDLPEDDLLIKQNILNCYVATTNDDVPCYREWLMHSSQNSKIKSFFGKNLPLPNENEAILERAYTIPSFRGLYVMPAAMSKIALKGNELGVRWIITCVGIDNIPSLKGCKRSGFFPYKLRVEKWRLFKQEVTTFNEIPEKLLKKTAVFD